MQLHIAIYHPFLVAVELNIERNVKLLIPIHNLARKNIKLPNRFCLFIFMMLLNAGIGDYTDRYWERVVVIHGLWSDIKSLINAPSIHSRILPFCHLNLGLACHHVALYDQCIVCPKFFICFARGQAVIDIDVECRNRADFLENKIDGQIWSKYHELHWHGAGAELLAFKVDLEGGRLSRLQKDILLNHLWLLWLW